jgi:malonyl CoA-acyl carrier protein transacylase
LTSYVFPGTAVDQSGLESGFARANAAVFDRRFRSASEFSGVDLLAALDDPASLSDLEGQFFTYAFSCAAFESLKPRLGPPRMAAGYSMGVYSACFALGAFSFETGLRIIGGAYGIMARRCRGLCPGMGGVIGLSEDEIRALLPESGDVEIANVNNPASVVISGPAGPVRAVLDAAAEEGALSTRALPASIPYHHSRILSGSSADLAAMLQSLAIAAPCAPLFSCVDQKPAATPEEIRTALSANLDSNIRWGDTYLAMDRLGAVSFADPGPGRSLSKIARFLGAGAPMADLRTLSQPA